MTESPIKELIRKFQNQTLPEVEELNKNPKHTETWNSSEHLENSEYMEDPEYSPRAEPSEIPRTPDNKYQIIGSQGFHKGNLVDPFCYTLLKIPFRIFLTLHYRTARYYGKTQDAISFRRDEIYNLISQTKYELSLKMKDIHYFGTDERGISDRIHTHILIYLKDYIIPRENEILNKIVELLPSEIIDIPQSRKSLNPPNIELVRDSGDVSSYICKLFAPTYYLKQEYMSDYFVKFVEGLQKYQNKAVTE